MQWFAIFPRLLSKIYSLIFLSGGRIKIYVTRKKDRTKTNKVLEVPCLIKVKAPFNVCSKAEPIIIDLLKRLMNIIQSRVEEIVCFPTRLAD